MSSQERFVDALQVMCACYLTIAVFGPVDFSGSPLSVVRKWGLKVAHFVAVVTGFLSVILLFLASSKDWSLGWWLVAPLCLGYVLAHMFVHMQILKSAPDVFFPKDRRMG